MFSSRIALTLLITTWLTSPARADCTCRCVDGVARTLCTGLDEAATRIDTCGDAPPTCPPPALAADVARFDPPPGATQCRSARLLDPATRAYSVDARICEVGARAADQDPAR